MGDEALRCFGVRGAVCFRIRHLLVLPIHCWTNRSAEGRATREPRFYLRLGPRAGLTLVRVLRGGLELGECLGVTAGRANGSLETAPRTLVPDPGAVGEEQAPHRRLGDPGASALGSSAWSDRDRFRGATFPTFERKMLMAFAEQYWLDTSNEHFLAASRTRCRSFHVGRPLWRSHVSSFRPK